jgi:hypothetical protein
LIFKALLVVCATSRIFSALMEMARVLESLVKNPYAVDLGRKGLKGGPTRSGQHDARRT